jgi:hypothetical protein
MRALAFAAVAVAAAAPALLDRELDPTRLSLPPQGFAVNRPAGVLLRDLRGTSIGLLSGYRVVDLYGPRPRGEVVVAKGKRTFALGRRGLRAIRRPRADWPRSGHGCHAGPLPYVICGSPYSRKRAASTVYLHGRKLVGPVGRYGGAPTFVGHWRSVERSPDRRTLLLQWSAECEVPVAYFANADGSHLHPVSGDSGVESGALGWARDGRAAVAFPKGACGGTRHVPGTYLVDPRTGRASLAFRGFGAFWG